MMKTETTQVQATKKIDLTNIVSAMQMKDKTVYVIVPSIRRFKKDLADQYGSRKNVRWDLDKQVHYKLNDYVRDTLKLRGRHIDIKLVQTTKKSDMYRTEEGNYVRLQ
jgi:hypothetical protein